MISFYYNNNYYPPAPVLQIVLRDDDNQESGQYEILIDSGADATIIPRGWLKGLNVVPTGSGNVTSYWGIVGQKHFMEWIFGLGQSFYPPSK